MDDEWFRMFTFWQVRQQNAALELMAERMLVDPSGYGIAMIQFADKTVMTLEEGIPFGHIFEFPSKHSFDCWVERGRPS